MTTETWLPVVGFEGLYEVSDHGRVKSYGRIGNPRVISGTKARILAGNINSSGYTRFALLKNSIPTHALAHWLVLEAFVGKRPDGFHGCHNDGNPANNALSNLRWDSASNNAKDKVKHGRQPMDNFTHPTGQFHPRTKLSNEDVRRIREARLFGARTVDLASVYGLKKSGMSSIVNRKTWRHI